MTLSTIKSIYHRVVFKKVTRGERDASEVWRDHQPKSVTILATGFPSSTTQISYCLKTNRNSLYQIYGRFKFLTHDPIPQGYSLRHNPFNWASKASKAVSPSTRGSTMLLPAAPGSPREPGAAVTGGVFILDEFPLLQRCINQGAGKLRNFMC